MENIIQCNSCFHPILLDEYHHQIGQVIECPECNEEIEIKDELLIF